MVWIRVFVKNIGNPAGIYKTLIEPALAQTDNNVALEFSH
jgi:hypothetical protein